MHARFSTKLRELKCCSKRQGKLHTSFAVLHVAAYPDCYDIPTRSSEYSSLHKEEVTSGRDTSRRNHVLLEE